MGHPPSGRGAGKDAHQGDRKTEEAPCSSVVPPGVHGGHRGALSTLQPHGRPDVPEFDLTATAPREWVRQAEIDASERAGVTRDERDELAQLRRQSGRRPGVAAEWLRPGTRPMSARSPMIVAAMIGPTPL